MMQANCSVGVEPGYWVIRVPPEAQRSLVETRGTKEIVDALKSATAHMGITAAIVPLTSALDLDVAETPGRDRPRNKVHSELDQPTDEFLRVVRSRLQTDPRLSGEQTVYLPPPSLRTEVIILVKGKYAFSDRVSGKYLRMWWSGCQESYDIVNQDVGRPCGSGKEHGVWILAPRVPLEQQVQFTAVGTYRSVDEWVTTGSIASSLSLEGGAQYSLVPSVLARLRLDTDEQEVARDLERARNREALARTSFKKRRPYTSGIKAALAQVEAHFSDPANQNVGMVYYPSPDHRALFGFVCVKIGHHLRRDATGQLYLPDDDCLALKQEMDAAWTNRARELGVSSDLQLHGQASPSFLARLNPVVQVSSRLARRGELPSSDGSGWPCSLETNTFTPLTVANIIRYQKARKHRDNYIHPSIAYLDERFSKESMVWLLQFALSDRERAIQRDQEDATYVGEEHADAEPADATYLGEEQAEQADVVRMDVDQ
jgi:hypothetical protein